MNAIGKTGGVTRFIRNLVIRNMKNVKRTDGYANKKDSNVEKVNARKSGIKTVHTIMRQCFG